MWFPKFIKTFVEKIRKRKPVAVQPVTPEEEWQALFKHCRIINPEFNPQNYPLESSGNTTPVKPVGFNDWLSGHDVLKRFAHDGLTPAKLRAAKRFLRQNAIQPNHPVAVAGAQWVNPRYGHICIPVFQNIRGETVVCLHFIDGNYIPLTIWLVEDHSPAAKPLPVKS